MVKSFGESRGAQCLALGLGMAVKVLQCCRKTSIVWELETAVVGPTSDRLGGRKTWSSWCSWPLEYAHLIHWTHYRKLKLL
jgi:hypothetical protein